MMRRSGAVAPVGSLYPAAFGPLIPVGFNQLTLALSGLALYLFCVHSFKLPLASLGIALGLLGVLGNRRGVTFPAPLLFMGAFLAWCSMGLVTSRFGPAVTDRLIEFLKIFLIFFVAINAAKTMEQLTVFIGTWVFFFGAYPARGTYFNFVMGINSFGRYGWNFSFENYNDLAGYSILVMALSAFLLMGRYPKWVRVGAMISTAGLALLVVITQSRGGFVGLVVGFVLMLLRSRSRTKLIKFGVLAAVIISAAAPDAVWKRFSNMKFLLNTETIAEADTSAEQRWILLQVAASIAREHMGTGVGLGAYPFAHAEYAEQREEWAFGRGERDAHNMYMSLAAETGVPGLLLFLGMLGSILMRATKLEGKLRASMPREAEQLRILRFGLVAYMVAAIFGSIHKVSFLYLYMAIVWSAAALFEEALQRGGGQAAPMPVPHPSMRRAGLRGQPMVNPFRR